MFDTYQWDKTKYITLSWVEVNLKYCINPKYMFSSCLYICWLVAFGSMQMLNHTSLIHLKQWEIIKFKEQFPSIQRDAKFNKQWEVPQTIFVALLHKIKVHQRSQSTLSIQLIVHFKHSWMLFKWIINTFKLNFANHLYKKHKNSKGRKKLLVKHQLIILIENISISVFYFHVVMNCGFFFIFIIH